MASSTRGVTVPPFHARRKTGYVTSDTTPRFLNALEAVPKTSFKSSTISSGTTTVRTLGRAISEPPNYSRNPSDPPFLVKTVSQPVFFGTKHPFMPQSALKNTPHYTIPAPFLSIKSRKTGKTGDFVPRIGGWVGHGPAHGAWGVRPFYCRGCREG